MSRNYRATTIILSGLLVLTGCGTTASNQQAMDKPFEVEYGKAISVNPADYFKKESKDALKNIKLDSKTKIENEKGKSYPSVGEYTLTFNNTNKNAKEKTMTVKVIVKDSVKPNFVDVQDEYKVKVGDKLKVELFNVDDVSNVTVTLDDSKVDYSKEGSYQATLKAVDTSKNETTKEIKVVVSAEAKSVDEQVKEAEAKAPAPTPSATNNQSNTSVKPTPSTSTNKPVQPSKPSQGTTNKPSKPSHTHQWVEQFETIHHDAKYKEEQVWVVDTPSQQRPIYEDVLKYQCHCGKVFNTYAEWDSHCDYYVEQNFEGNISDDDTLIHMGWGDKYESVLTGYETIPEQGHYETKKTQVSAAWDEQVSKGYKCSCGATK